MAGNAYQTTLANGVRSMARAIQSSAGAGDAGKIVALNAAGRIDPTALCGASTWPLLDVSGGTGAGTLNIQSISSAFTKINFGNPGGYANVNVDTASGFSLANSLYTIPVTGTYLISSKLRWMDSGAANISYGQGVDVSNGDGPYFQWFITPAITGGSQRNGSLNVRIARFTAGQALQFFAYVDGTTLSVAAASLNIALLAVG